MLNKEFYHEIAKKEIIRIFAPIYIANRENLRRSGPSIQAKPNSKLKKTSMIGTKIH